MLPEVRAAMDEAARKYVHLDELADAVGARLADAHRRGVGPRHQRLLRWADARHCRLRRWRQSRSPRAAAESDGLRRRTKPSSRRTRATSTTPRSAPSVSASSKWPTPAEFEAALGPRTALDLHHGRARASTRVRSTSRRSRRSRRPRAYRCRRCRCRDPDDPQRAPARTARRSSATAAASACAARRPAACCSGARIWCAPPGSTARRITASTRSLKVGKEDAIGMLMAVEMWVKRDHDAEWKRWTRRARSHRAAPVGDCRRHRPSVVQPNGLSNRTPSLRITVGSAEARARGRRRGPGTARRRAAHRDGRRPAVRRR